MEKLDKLLSKLNSDQIKPVLDTEGAVLVVAGAGSGKTSVLTSRIAYLVLEKKVEPSNILAITFTNKAANEMKERLEKIVGNVSSMWVSTIHSMCVRILRSAIELLGYDKNFTIYDEGDKEKTLKRVFEDLNITNDTLKKSAKNIISNAKNDCLSPEEWYAENRNLGNPQFAKDMFDVYNAYEQILARSNSLDFDDLLVKTFQLFVAHPEVADYYSKKFKYVHVDEFQDTNKVQYLIIRRLAISHGNIFVVGDEDQSIYSWRGAKVENILEFDKTYTGAKIYKLERNYRSTKKILTLANAIIQNNTQRRGKNLWTENDEGVRIETFVGDEENNEATYVAMQIKSLMDRSNYNYSDFAVFMRINALSRAFEQEFAKYNIPYKVFGGFRFFERKEVKDVLAYLKVICNPKDDESFIRAVATPRRGIGDKTLEELREFAFSIDKSMFDAIDFLAQSTISSGAIKKLGIFKDMLNEFSAFAENQSASELIKKVLETTSFMDQFIEKTEENRARVMNVNELINVAELFEKDNPSTTIADFLNSVTLSSDTDELKDGNFVTVATIHAVKGLEFPCVFVSGLDESILPVGPNITDEEMEEERRLMYVAITRAKQRLYLTRASSRYLYGKRTFLNPSRFLKEAQKVLSPGLKVDNASSIKSFGGGETNLSHGYSDDYAKTFLKQSVAPKTALNNNFSEYKVGISVLHVKFGEGKVIAIKGSGENLIVEVNFKGFGVKSLSVKYAPMKII